MKGNFQILGSSSSPGPRSFFRLRVILWWPFENPSYMPNVKSLALAFAEILKENPKFLQGVRTLQTDRRQTELRRQIPERNVVSSSKNKCWNKINVLFYFIAAFILFYCTWNYGITHACMKKLELNEISVTTLITFHINNELWNLNHLQINLISLN